MTIELVNVKFSLPPTHKTPPEWYFCEVEFRVGNVNFVINRVTRENNTQGARKIVVRYLADKIFEASEAMDNLKK